jgi:hypothetical protein
MYITDTAFNQAHNPNTGIPSAGHRRTERERMATAAPVFQDAEFGPDGWEELS